LVLKNKYNLIAPFYSLLSKLVFGNNLINIQLELIKTLPTQGKLLIIGGGNGKILPYIFSHSSKLSIDYVEASSKMIEMAQSKAPSTQDISFIHSDKLAKSEFAYDAVYLAFFLDLFNSQKIQEWLKSIESICDPNFTLHVADFHLSPATKFNLYRRLQVKASILFFKIVAKHRTDKLQDIFKIIAQSNYKSLTMRTLKGGFYRSQVFTKG